MELSLRADELAWREWFAGHGIEPLEIVYEDLCERYEECLRATLEFLGREGDISQPRLRRQRDGTTEAWVREYIGVRRTWWPPPDEAYGLGLIDEEV